MKKYWLWLCLFCVNGLQGQTVQKDLIRVSTETTDLILRVGDNGRLYQAYLGERLANEADVAHFSTATAAGSGKNVEARGWEVYPASGMEDYFEPALAIDHADGNRTTLLRYVSSVSRDLADGVTETVILLEDEVYPVEVRLHYVAFAKENIFKTWTEISHREKKPVRLFRYASAMLYLESPRYFLTEFSGDWAREAGMSSQELKFGKKIIDTKLGTRAAMHVCPFFQLGLEHPVAENEGQVLVGTIGWTGNFGFTFEVDHLGNLRVISGINPYAADYELRPGEIFRTPEFIFTLSAEGAGKASRDFHDWARRHQVREGNGQRLTLLNNWESTGFRFDEEKLTALIGEAGKLGVDMFLLDDGWFGNKYPRNDDKAGLGDWEPMKSKLPRGITPLVQEAAKAGVKFGIWIEPEMVNPRSELFEKHPEWVIQQPGRELYYFRNQLVLDMSNPQVQDYVYGVVEKLMTENPEIAFLKWDCNSPLTNIHSPYLKEKQSRLYVGYVRGFYRVLERLKKKYPALPMMLCAGGGGRCDYEALRYFTEFWPSDNTDPLERIYIQWGFSQLFPSQVLCAHVTGWGRQPLKFRTDVAMMGKLGFDIDLAGLTPEEQAFCREAVKNFKRLSPVILGGDFYRLVSPYETAHAAVMHVAKGKDKALLYTYDLHPRFGEKLFPVKLQGLDPHREYTIEEINRMPSEPSRLAVHGKTYSGDYLMKVGIDAFTGSHTRSRILEITAR